MKRLSRWFWQRTYTGYLVCTALDHGPAGRLPEKGNENCDCGADHTYTGCARCRVAV